MFIPYGEMQVGSVLSSVSAISTPVFAFLCTHDSCSKSFWDSPLVEGPGRQVHPKTTTFCLVLGFTPSRQPYRAYQSQNDLEQRYSSPSVRFVWHFPAPFRRLRFPRCVTSGNAQPAFQAPLWHFPLFPIYHIRMKNGLPRTFSS